MRRNRGGTDIDLDEHVDVDGDDTDVDIDAGRAGEAAHDEHDEPEEHEPAHEEEPARAPTSSRFVSRAVGREWGVWDTRDNVWVRIGRNAGVATSRWDSEEEAVNVARQLSDADPEQRRMIARWGLS